MIDWAKIKEEEEIRKKEKNPAGPALSPPLSQLGQALKLAQQPPPPYFAQSALLFMRLAAKTPQQPSSLLFSTAARVGLVHPAHKHSSHSLAAA